MIALAILVLLALTRGSAQTGQLTIVTPAGASSQVSINITGTGFNTTAANNEVSFVPAGGATAIASATSIATVDATRDLRRITVRVPAGLPTGTTALRVRNTVTGLFSEGRSLEVIALSLPDVRSATAGTSNLDVRVTGSSNTNFVAGKTQIGFGTGITVNSVAVKSPTELVANITVPGNVAPSVRTLQMSSAQTAVLPGAFTIAAAPPPNSNPAITSSPITVANETLPYTYDVNATDPDAGDTVIFSLGQAPSGMTIDPATGVISWTPGAAHVPAVQVRVQALDGRGGSAEQAFSVGVAPANRAPAANANGPYSATAGQAIAFSSAGSTDPDQDPLVYAWSFGDGSKSNAAAPTHTYATPGDYTVSLTVDDLKGGIHTATATANVRRANGAPDANAGGPYSGEAGVAVLFSAASSTDPDGDALSYAWNFGDGGTSQDQKPSHVYAEPGVFNVTLTVTDSESAADMATVNATIAVAADRAPPVVTVSGPKEALPGAQLTVAAEAFDNVAVQSVTLDVDGADPVTLAAAPYQRVVNVPEFAAPGATLKVNATARDAAGNTGTALATVTVVAVPDTEAPTATVRAPHHAAPGATLQIAAVVFDNAGIDTVILSAGGTAVATWHGPPFETSYTIPETATVGSIVTFSAQAIDTSDNRATGSASVEIVQAPDTAPPTVTLSAPSTAQAGTTVPVTAVAADDAGVASVAFFVDGARIASLINPPYEAVVNIPADLPAGARVRVEARALDFTGLPAFATRSIDILATGQGVLTGEVYDDVRGLALEGATVALTGNDARGVSYSQSTVSDATGRYVIHATEGSGIIRITKAGWSDTDRVALIKAGTAIELVDARLMAVSASAPIAALAGGIVTGDTLAFLRLWQREVSAVEDPSLGTLPAGSPDVRLTIPAGALTANATVTLTPVSRQSLAGLFPAGWTPAAILDVGPHGTVLAGGASLVAPNPLNLKAGASLVFTRWDEQARAWRALTSSLVVDRGDALTGTIFNTGQFAWIVADTIPQPPPHPAPGDLVSGVAATLVPQGVTAIVDPQPKILFYKPDVKSDVRGTVTTTTGVPLSSGTIVQARIIESYWFVSDAQIHLEPTVQDVVLYQIPGGPQAVMAAGFPVSPSLSFEPLSFDHGVITVELRAPEEAVHEIELIGAGGGSVVAPTGQRLDVVTGSTAQSVPIEVRPLTLQTLGAAVPPGFEFVDGARLFFAGSLSLPATFSVARPAQAADGDLFLLTRLQELDGQTRFVLVGLGAVTGDRIAGRTILAGTDVMFEGVLAAGRYVFLRAANPLAFAAGTVTGEGGAFSGALVSSNTLPIVALSQATGRYISALALGAMTLTARDLNKTDRVSVDGTTSTALQVLPLNLALVARPPTVTSVTPVNGAVNIALGDPVVVRFSSPIDPATATLQTVQLTSSSGIVFGALALTANNTIATFRPVDALQPNTTYTLTLSESIKDPFGRSLSSAFVAGFTSLDTVAPLPPAAGSLTASIPGLDGKTTITATQGTAGAHDTVVIRNLTTGAATPVILDANGGFTVNVIAALADKLQLLIVDSAGNQSTTALPRFHRANADGSISEVITREGGRLLGPGCTVLDDGVPRGPACITLDIPSGAFPLGTVVTVKPVAEADFPVHLTPEQQQVFSFTGGLQLDLGGQTPTTYINVSLTAGATDTQVDRWVVGQVLTVNGQQLLNVTDTARLIDQRVTTSSPPCPGVTGSGVYGFLKSARPIGVTFSRMPGSGSFVEALGMMADDLLQGSALQMPYSTTLDETFNAALGVIPKQVCLPVLSGRVTVAGNRFTVSIPQALLAASDEEVVVTNNAPGRGATARIYPPFQGSVSIEGNENDPVVIEVHSRALVNGILSDVTRTLGPADCTQRGLAADCLKATGRSFVAIEIPASELLPGDRSVQVENVQTKTRAAVALIGTRLATIRLIVEGTAANTYLARVVDKVGANRQVVPLAPTSYPIAPGNLLVRAIPGAIDPTRKEIVDYNANRPADAPAIDPNRGVKKVILETRHLGTLVRSDVILDAAANNVGRVVTGGFFFALDGDVNDDLTIRVEYEDGRVDDMKLPSFRIRITDTTTQQTRREIVRPAPAPDDTLLLHVFDENSVVPELVGGLERFIDFDPAKPITLVFSAPLLAQNLALFAVFDASTGKKISGQVRLSERDRVLTFVPDQPLELGNVYRVSLIGQTDLLGRPLPAGIRTIPLTTFTPRLLSTYRELNALKRPIPFGDLALSRPTASGATRSILTAVTPERGVATTRTLDVTDAAHPVKAGVTTSLPAAKRVVVRPGAVVRIRTHPPLPGTPPPPRVPMSVPGCEDHIPAGAQFVGDLAVVSSYVTSSSAMSFLDVTDPAKPCMLGAKMVTANPAELTHANRRGTVRGVGAARGVATIQHDDGIAAYMAVAEVGVLAVDVGQNTPEVSSDDREMEGFYSGDYRDVAAIGARLFAANNAFDAGATVDVFDANLSLIGSVALNVKPRRLVAAAAVHVDLDGNGQINGNEVFDFVFAAGIGGVDIVNVTDPDNPALVGHVDAPGIIRELAVAHAGRRLFAGGDRGTVSGEAFFIFDVSNPFSASGARKLFEVPYYSGIGGLQADDERGLAYIAHATGVDVYAVDPPSLSGVIKYTSYKISQGIDSNGKSYGFVNYEDPLSKPVRGATLELRNQNNEVIARGVTTDSGYYAFRAPKNSVVSVTVRAELGGPTRPHVQVRDNSNVACLIHDTDPDCNLYQESFAVLLGSLAVTKDVTFVSGWNNGTKRYSGRREAAPFAILDTVHEAEKFVRRVDAAVTFPKLTINWSKLNRSQDKDRKPAGALTGPIDGGARFEGASNDLFLNGLEDEDTDEYDAGVVLHEWAHYLVHNFGRDDSLAGRHSKGDILDATVAFSEGFATAFAGMVGDGLYIDTHGAGQATSKVMQNVEKDANPDGLRFNGIVVDGSYIEGTVAEVLYDLFDQGDPGDYDNEFNDEPTIDDLALGFRPLYDALIRQQQTPAFVTIFSFLSALRDIAPASAAQITALATDENVNGDEFESASSTLYNTLNVLQPNNATPQPTDHTTPFNGQPLQTWDRHGPITQTDHGNKLYNWRYFKFTISEPIGCYAIEVRPLPATGGVPTDVVLRLKVKGTAKNVDVDTPKVFAATERLLRLFTNGVHTMAVGSLATPTAPGPTAFTIRLEKRPAADCP